MRNLFKRIALFCLLVLAAQVIVSLEWKWERDLETGRAEGLQIRVPKIYEPDAEILSIQEHQVEHPTLGFLWKPSITVQDNVIVGWGDIPAGAITTDDIGFANGEEAATARLQGERPDIIGVGASYLGGAQNLFYDYFSLNGYSYHNMAHGRFTQPQFNVALEQYALPLKPKWIIYGLNEVSFTLIPDFEAWKESGQGWFEYHGGTWCGPPDKSGLIHDLLKPFPRTYRIFRAVMSKTLRGALEKKPTRQELVEKTVQYIEDAYKTCRDNDVGFIVLCIPAKVRMVQGSMPSLYLFEEIVPKLEKAGVPLIDLRKSFEQIEDPSQLFFQIDAHWNNGGIYHAAREVLAHIENAENNRPGSDK